MSVKEYDYTTDDLGEDYTEKTYTYSTSIRDRLDNFNGHSITYNAMGCPTSFNGFDATWTRGKLSGLSRQGSQISYDYNAFGQRISKTYSGSTDYRCEFCYDESGRLVCETKYSDSGSVIDKIIYLYDVNSIIGMVHTLNGVESTYYFQRNLFGDVIGIYNTNGIKVGGYAYDAWGNHAVTLDTNGIATRNPIRYRGYYYDTESGLYYLNARYYNPEWRRFISPDDTAYLDPESVNGLNLYAYCNNNPVNYKQRPVSSGSSIIISSISSGGLAGNKISGNAVRQIAKTLSSKSSGFNLFGYELRTSTGWDPSPYIATSFFVRIGFSSYVTHTKGQSGMLYGFAGSTSDVMNQYGTTYYAGIGINLFDILGVEAYLETVGIGAQVSIGNFSIGANINLIGGTSITFGWDTDLGNGMTKTKGVTVGLNTGCLVAVICWIYKFVITGDLSPVPGLQPA